MKGSSGWCRMLKTDFFSIDKGKFLGVETLTSMLTIFLLLNITAAPIVNFRKIS